MENNISIKSNQKDILFIVNPKSSSGKTANNWKSYYDEINKSYKDRIVVYITKKQGESESITRKYLKKNFSMVIAVGGDGTINEVCHGFFKKLKNNRQNEYSEFIPLDPINENAVLAIIPSGTRNVLANSLNLSQNPFEISKNLKKMKIKKIDLISVNFPSKKGISRLCLNALEIGIGAEIGTRAKQIKKITKNRFLSTVSSLLATIPSYQSNECKISLNSEVIDTNCNLTMATISNGRYIGGGIEIAYDAKMDDGKLDVVILTDSGSFKILTELLDLTNKKYYKKDNVIYKQVKNVKIVPKTGDVSLTCDGEPIGTLPASFNIHNKMINILVPVKKKN